MAVVVGHRFAQEGVGGEEHVVLVLLLISQG